MVVILLSEDKDFDFITTFTSNRWALSFFTEYDLKFWKEVGHICFSNIIKR